MQLLAKEPILLKGSIGSNPIVSAFVNSKYSITNGNIV